MTSSSHLSWYVYKLWFTNRHTMALIFVCINKCTRNTYSKITCRDMVWVLVMMLCPVGTGSGETDFGPQLKGLDKKHFTVVAFDPRGYGRSRPPNRDFPSDFFHRDAQDGLQLMQVRQWTDAACSWIHCLSPSVLHPLSKKKTKKKHEPWTFSQRIQSLGLIGILEFSHSSVCELTCVSWLAWLSYTELIHLYPNTFHLFLSVLDPGLWPFFITGLEWWRHHSTDCCSSTPC